MKNDELISLDCYVIGDEHACISDPYPGIDDFLEAVANGSGRTLNCFHVQLIDLNIDSGDLTIFGF